MTSEIYDVIVVDFIKEILVVFNSRVYIDNDNGIKSFSYYKLQYCYRTFSCKAFCISYIVLYNL